MVDALRRNEITSFIVAISKYKSELNDKPEEGIKLDTEYQNLREKVTQNQFENVKTN